ncbi:hypothetical protein B0H66DRAFT_13121 [Apodospora peruviana]|uniref:Uncharacterized protein n=1 Tax=Apodospora peruviana TaxID=516989 RepID=A0AAE0IQ39_9PEZI|nr:hypothetical protein B0H66DRAFT_13121 [Apodospora peruviana]
MKLSAINTNNTNNTTTTPPPSSPYCPTVVFRRPMDPAPAPLVYINGRPGVGKQAVAECLVLLLGQDKSLLVDIRGVGMDDDERHDDDDDDNKQQQKQTWLITPEHPAYHYDHHPSSHARQRSHTYSSSSSSSRPRAASPMPPCSQRKLARLLDQPANASRIAILTSYAPDTPGGRSAVRTFAAAAAQAGRLFIPIALTCEPAEHSRRAQSLQRQCSHKTKTLAGQRRASVSPTPSDVSSCSSNNGNSGGGNSKGGGGGSGNGRQKSLVLAPAAAGIRVGDISGRASGSGRMGGKKTNGNDGCYSYEMTVDITRASAFETALQIVESVKALVAERDAELLSCSNSAVTTPVDSTSPNWKQFKQLGGL